MLRLSLLALMAVCFESGSAAPKEGDGPTSMARGLEGQVACLDADQCRQAFLSSNLSGDFYVSNWRTKGCFSKNDNAFFGTGGTPEEMLMTDLPTLQERIWCSVGANMVTDEPTKSPTPELTPEPTLDPTSEPTSEPSPEPTFGPTPGPTLEPTPEPTPEPTQQPTPERVTLSPSEQPDMAELVISSPTKEPTPEPVTNSPTQLASANPVTTNSPSQNQTKQPTSKPTRSPVASFNSTGLNEGNDGALEPVLPTQEVTVSLDSVLSMPESPASSDDGSALLVSPVTAQMLPTSNPTKSPSILVNVTLSQTSTQTMFPSDAPATVIPTYYPTAKQVLTEGNDRVQPGIDQEGMMSMDWAALDIASTMSMSMEVAMPTEEEISAPTSLPTEEPPLVLNSALTEPISSVMPTSTSESGPSAASDKETPPATPSTLTASTALPDSYHTVSMSPFTLVLFTNPQAKTIDTDNLENMLSSHLETAVQSSFTSTELSRVYVTAEPSSDGATEESHFSIHGNATFVGSSVPTTNDFDDVVQTSFEGASGDEFLDYLQQSGDAGLTSTTAVSIARESTSNEKIVENYMTSPGEESKVGKPLYIIAIVFGVVLLLALIYLIRTRRQAKRRRHQQGEFEGIVADQYGEGSRAGVEISVMNRTN